MSIQFKVVIGHHSIRRYTLPETTTHDEFKERIRQDFPAHIMNVTLQYVDDEEDYVTFSTEQEWQHAIQAFQQRGGNLFKVFVSKNRGLNEQQNIEVNPEQPRILPIPVGIVTGDVFDHPHLHHYGHRGHHRGGHHSHFGFHNPHPEHFTDENGMREPHFSSRGGRGGFRGRGFHCSRGLY
jgi:hypothetical protein